VSEFLVPIGRAFGDLILPLRLSFDSSEDVELFLLRHGWDARVDPVSVDAIRGAVAIVDLAEAVNEKLDVLVNGSAEDRARAVLELIEVSKGVIDRLDALGSVATGGLPFPFDQNAFWTGVSGELVDELTVSYLQRRQPFLFGVLHLLGVIRFERQAPAGAGRVPYINTKVYWDRLPRILTSPGDLFQETYQWNRPGQDFLHADLLRAVERTALAFNVPATIDAPQPRLGALLDPAAVTARGIGELEVPIIDGVSPDDSSYWKIGAVVMPIPDPVGANAAPSGVLISPLLQGQLDLSLPFTKDIGLHMVGAFEAGTSIAALIYPGKALAHADTAAASFDTRMELVGAPEEPWLLLGAPPGARLELDGFLAMFGARGRVTDPEFVFSIGTGEEAQKVRLVIAADEGDGFVQMLIGEGFTLDFGANLHWSSKRGVSFDGSAALEFAKSIHLELGPILVETVYVQARLGAGDRLDVNLGAGIKAVLGPLTVVIENVGLRVSLVPTAAGKRGAFGSLDLELGFKPPDGVGLAIDAGVVRGGGYLYFDFDKEEYAGALELFVSGFLTLTAVGLVTTRMPDGSKGFSLLIIITAEFGTGLQLGYGFTLIGVGGLLGLNRMVRMQPLGEGVRTGAINAILFPRDVVANAPRIISDLRAIFPPYEGKFLIGPMAKLGWGTPSLITLSLGVIIEIPGNVAIVGVLACLLPTPDAAVLVLQIAFVGVIEFDKKRIWLFAGLFESRVLTFTLEGEMGVLVAFGDDANFVLSVGGFNPRFKPPPLPFPIPKRLALTILDEELARIRVSCYFAVTTNTVQFGAHAELYFAFDAISVTGDIRFDALFQFSPFYFVIELSASISLKVFGMGVFSISLEMSLEGPTPWHAHGRASLSLFFLEVSASFDKTWGEDKDTTLPPIPVFQLLATELNKASSWSAVPPTRGNLLVSLRVVNEKTEFVLHPVGTLRVSQRAVPLNSTIDLVGMQKPSDANHFALAVKTPDLALAGTVKEQFAPAQFHAISKSEKLATPAFSREDGGLDITASGDQLRSSLVVRRVVRYEQVIVDTNFKRFVRRLVIDIGSLFQHFLHGNAAARSALSARAKQQMQPFDDTITTDVEGFGVASRTDNKMATGTVLFGSEAAAREHINETIAQNPALAGTLHVVPQFELNQAP
jgi:hypothetical protein